jgi:hypothetical protein
MHHALVHEFDVLGLLEPPFWSEGSRIFAKYLFVVMDYGGIKTDSPATWDVGAAKHNALFWRVALRRDRKRTVDSERFLDDSHEIREFDCLVLLYWRSKCPIGESGIDFGFGFCECLGVLH